ncbi:Hypothetical Protein FCC1311_111552 [Hondaea fermentalgiana]|uniref:Uncharacterized protein n=1 Tax=Hondaea fermentalgiana TaxID=2315210 RepID=A0A2R5GVQ5_9STRA|nr:Hypothetical Protein FCC1311_111552 [Hondaea fermentalgiana]|eukprot:GBG34932.1 Hypothetical Protein FCC1311_111552 [Hondaea fermentalgiana]
MADRMDALLEKKRALLAEQAAVAREFNHWLTAKSDDPNEDGALENSRKTTKNLEAAIAQSRNPGYFQYHRRSRRVRRMEKGNELAKLAARISRLEDQLRAVTAQIETLHEERRNAILTAKPPPVSGFQDWFRQFGEPSEEMKSRKGLASEFVPNNKVYGGTPHHRAFRSVAVTLKKGRATS